MAESHKAVAERKGFRVPAIGRAVADHHANKVPAAPFARWDFKRDFLRLYREWLENNRGLTDRQIQQHLSDLRNVKRLVADRDLPSEHPELDALEKVVAFRRMTGNRRSQLRHSLTLLAAYSDFWEEVGDDWYHHDRYVIDRKGRLKHMGFKRNPLPGERWFDIWEDITVDPQDVDPEDGSVAMGSGSHRDHVGKPEPKETA